MVSTALGAIVATFHRSSDHAETPQSRTRGVISSESPNLGKIRRRACLRLIPFPGTGDVLLAPTMISHPLAYVAPTTRHLRKRKNHNSKSQGQKSNGGSGKRWWFCTRQCGSGMLAIHVSELKLSSLSSRNTLGDTSHNSNKIGLSWGGGSVWWASLCGSYGGG